MPVVPVNSDTLRRSEVCYDEAKGAPEEEVEVLMEGRLNKA